MKFEFVEFYPNQSHLISDRRTKCLGTVHVYAIDCELDIRGIVVSRRGKSLFFSIPHFYGFDEETGKPTRYPLIHWTKAETQQEMMDFLHKEVKPEVVKRLFVKSK